MNRNFLNLLVGLGDRFYLFLAFLMLGIVFGNHHHLLLEPSHRLERCFFIQDQDVFFKLVATLTQFLVIVIEFLPACLNASLISFHSKTSLIPKRWYLGTMWRKSSFLLVFDSIPIKIIQRCLHIEFVKRSNCFNGLSSSSPILYISCFL